MRSSAPRKRRDGKRDAGHGGAALHPDRTVDQPSSKAATEAAQGRRDRAQEDFERERARPCVSSEDQVYGQDQTPVRRHPKSRRRTETVISLPEQLNLIWIHGQALALALRIVACHRHNFSWITRFSDKNHPSFAIALLLRRGLIVPPR
jgi:hypothetical protein